MLSRFSCVHLFATPSTVLCPWDFPCENTGVGCHFLLQGIFPIQGSNLCLLHLLQWQVDSLPLYTWEGELTLSGSGEGFLGEVSLEIRLLRDGKGTGAWAEVRASGPSKRYERRSQGSEMQQGQDWGNFLHAQGLREMVTREACIMGTSHGELRACYPERHHELPWWLRW